MQEKEKTGYGEGLYSVSASISVVDIEGFPQVERWETFKLNGVEYVVTDISIPLDGRGSTLFVVEAEYMDLGGCGVEGDMEDV